MPRQIHVMCEVCDGTGERDWLEGGKCRECDGLGFVVVSEEYEDDDYLYDDEPATTPTPDATSTSTVERARQALKPFAGLVDGYWSHDGQHDFLDSDIVLEQIGARVTVGDIREADRVYRALAAPTADGEVES